MYLMVPAPFDPLRITLYRAFECDVIIKRGLSWSSHAGMVFRLIYRWHSHEDTTNTLI